MQIHNPYNPPIPLPPPVPMSNSYTTLIPGPFILLLLLPSIPLLLFSIGARPPDTSALPFSMTEVFTTAAFVSVAGGVVMGLVIWPDMGKNVGGWMAGSASGSGSGGATTAIREGLWDRMRSGMGIVGPRTGHMVQQSTQAGQAQSQQIQDAAVKVTSKLRSEFVRVSSFDHSSSSLSSQSPRLNLREPQLSSMQSAPPSSNCTTPPNRMFRQPSASLLFS